MENSRGLWSTVRSREWIRPRSGRGIVSPRMSNSIPMSLRDMLFIEHRPWTKVHGYFPLSLCDKFVSEGADVVSARHLQS
jgi:hypothetical protein